MFDLGPHRNVTCIRFKKIIYKNTGKQRAGADGCKNAVKSTKYTLPSTTFKNTD